MVGNGMLFEEKDLAMESAVEGDLVLAAEDGRHHYRLFGEQKVKQEK